MARKQSPTAIGYFFWKGLPFQKLALCVLLVPNIAPDQKTLQIMLSVAGAEIGPF